MTGIEQLPEEYKGELLLGIKDEFFRSGKTIVVLDDDPTGTQTCYDVTVLTSWQVSLLVTALKKNPSILFILTNSRSLTQQAAIRLAKEIGTNLTQAVKLSERQITLISRSDSTLRGHFPAEVKAIAEAMNLGDAVWVLLPAFIEGGRLTLDDVHYLKEQDELVPVADTPFARDSSFGYKNSNLKKWVEEKTGGQYKAVDVVSFSLEEIRQGGPPVVADKLQDCKAGCICIVNCCSYKDMEVFVAGLQMAEKKGKKFLCRTSATFVPIRAGLVSGKIYRPIKSIFRSPNGSLLIVGSYVPKTTHQLDYLLANPTHTAIEIDVVQLLNSDEVSVARYAQSVLSQIELLLVKGIDVAIYTSRKLETGRDVDENLAINSNVASFLVRIVKGLTVRPSFVVAKGGITASDIASKGLTSETALLLGQVIPGVPVWKLDGNSKFPNMELVVFPGNVGDAMALAEICKIMAAPLDLEP